MKNSRYYQFVGSQLRQYRINKGLSLEDVAEKVGVTKKTIANYELAATKISPELTKKLLTIYGVDVTSFMNIASQYM